MSGIDNKLSRTGAHAHMQKEPRSESGWREGKACCSRIPVDSVGRLSACLRPVRGHVAHTSIRHRVIPTLPNKNNKAMCPE